MNKKCHFQQNSLNNESSALQFERLDGLDFRSTQKFFSFSKGYLNKITSKMSENLKSSTKKLQMHKSTQS